VGLRAGPESVVNTFLHFPYRDLGRLAQSVVTVLTELSRLSSSSSALN